MQTRFIEFKKRKCSLLFFITIFMEEASLELFCCLQFRSEQLKLLFYFAVFDSLNKLRWLSTIYFTFLLFTLEALQLEILYIFLTFSSNFSPHLQHKQFNIRKWPVRLLCHFMQKIISRQLTLHLKQMSIKTIKSDRSLKSLNLLFCLLLVI